MNWLDTLGMLLGGAAVLAFAALTLFRFGSRIGEWFSGLASDNRKLYWAAIGMACWIVVVAVVAWVVAFLVYLTYLQPQPASLNEWAGAASVALVLSAIIVVLLAGIPWRVLVWVVRAVRSLNDLKASTPEGREMPLVAWLSGEPSPTQLLSRFWASRLRLHKGETAGSLAQQDEAPEARGDDTSGKAGDSSS